MSVIDNLENILANGQDNALLRFGLGQAYLQQNDYDKAIEHLQYAIQHDQNYSAAWKLLGKAQAELRQYAEAIHTYQRGIEIAMAKGDVQAAKEMQVFMKRCKKALE